MFSQAKIYSGPWAEYSTMVINFMTAEGKFLLLAWTLSHQNGCWDYFGLIIREREGGRGGEGREGREGREGILQEEGRLRGPMPTRGRSNFKFTPVP